MITPKPMRLEKLSPRSLHLSYEIGRAPLSNRYGPNGDVALTARFAPRMKCTDMEEERTVQCPAFVEISDELIGAVEMSKSDDRDVAVCALSIVRDGVITGEGPQRGAAFICPVRSMLETSPGARVS